jgi:arsenate reductase
MGCFTTAYRLYPNKASNQEEIRLNFICTHNSRRSHLSQVWAQTASSILISVVCFATLAALKLLLCSQWQQKTLAISGFKVKNAF